MSELEILFQYNCSTIFLLYPLGLERRKMVPLGFKEAYLKDVEKTDIEYENPVYLLFKPESPTIFQAWLDVQYETSNKFTNTVDIIEDYDYKDGYVVVVYQFPKEFEGDYKKFLEGKYSKFSKKFKETYPKLVKIKTSDGRQMDEISVQFRITHRTMDLKEMLEEKLGVEFESTQEFFSKPDMGRETLSFAKIDAMETKKV